MIGGVIGMAVALGLMRLLSGLLFGGRAFDLSALVVVVLVLGASASLAAYLPHGAPAESIRSSRSAPSSADL